MASSIVGAPVETDFVLLSHRLDEVAPRWPGAPGLIRQPLEQIAAGHPVNTHVLQISTHYGTHCDVPYHFLDDGAALDGIDHRRFIFTRPRVVDLPLADRELITPERLESIVSDHGDADLLLFRSGFEAHRGDRTRYEQHGPGFSAAAARFLRERLPELRGIALDWLSTCSLAHVEEGLDAHRVLLTTDQIGAFVIIFEDVRVSALGPATPLRVLAMPLFVDGMDGSPCTILAEVAS